MKLPFLKKFSRKNISSYFLVLVLRNEKVNAVIFEEIEGKVKIIGQHQEYFSKTIEDADLEEFLEILDKAISEAEVSLPENVQTQKTIFGVKESWADNNQIKKEYLSKLKKACEELNLTPIGFLVISQAISHLLQKEEGAPISAILVEVNKKTLTITLIRGGKTVETESSEIHESIPFTVDILLKHFNTSEILPSRIIIFDEDQDLTQEFISHTFSKSLPFLHMPQIAHLSRGFDAKAVLFGAATQMGFEVLEEDLPKEEKIISQENPTVNTDNIDFSSENFGFFEDKDVMKMSSNINRGKENLKEIQKTPEEKPEIQEKLISKEKYNFLVLLKKSFGRIVKISEKFNIKKYFSLFSFHPKRKISFIVPAILALIILIIASYFLFVKATIVITVEPKITEKKQDVIFSTTSSDPKHNIIKGEFVTTSESGSVQTPTTGKKEVGEKAKGTVTIFNSLSEVKTLNKGTIIKSPSSLEFTLDESLTIKGVASHSADETVTPQKETVAVAADKIGKEYNLPSGTKFIVSSFDITDIVAKNDSPFSGGTKKEITVVSQKDNDKLQEDLPKTLEKTARESLSKKLSDDKVLLPAFIQVTLKEKTFDGKIGDEKNSVTLKGKVEYQSISYSKSDLISFSKSFLEKNLSPNQQVDYGNIRADVKDIKSKTDQEINSALVVKALLLPKINEENLRHEVKGISFAKAEEIIYKIPQVTNTDISLFPSFPFLPKNIPSFEKNIKVTIKIEK